jgi:hypothetical protein
MTHPQQSNRIASSWPPRLAGAVRVAVAPAAALGRGRVHSCWVGESHGLTLRHYHMHTPTPKGTSARPNLSLLPRAHPSSGYIRVDGCSPGPGVSPRLHGMPATRLLHGCSFD